MRIILIGGTGTIGSAVYRLLSPSHEVLRAARTGGEMRVDMASSSSIRGMFGLIGRFDALVCAAGQARFAPLAQLSDEDFAFCLANKLMGQVNLVRFGMEQVADGGSFTLTSGVLAQQPMPGSAAISLVNAGLEGFVRAAALEAPRGIRVNVVSPPWVRETLEMLGMDAASGVPAEQVAPAYRESVESRRTGEVISP
jgi:NAD(P)-dependent dehydrogenase (short-subunit alcohol dehydrogenase family)